jgi:hypothetical protein
MLFTFLFTKTTYIHEEVNCTDPSPSVSIPCFLNVVAAKKGLNEIEKLGHTL